MPRHRLLLGLFVYGVLSVPAHAQVQAEILARTRVFTDVGPGVRALKRDAAGRYYVLTAPGPAVLVYDAAGQRLGQVPAAAPAGAPPAASLVFGDAMDLDPSGRLYVADRSANAVQVFSPEGTLALSIPFPSPTAVAALPGGEFAVAGTRSERLVTVYDARGKLAREFGDPAEIAERRDLNRFLNIGRLATDLAGNIYYAFAYLPEPTVRKYDRYGYAAYEIALATLEFHPEALAVRREIQRQERGGVPSFKPLITAIGVDPKAQEIWISLGNVLLHFDQEGNPRGSYRTFTPEGVRLEVTAILVEPGRLLLAGDPLGTYEFPRPDKTTP